MSLRSIPHFLVAAIATASVAHAGTILVTSTADSGPGTLRDAIALANANPGMDRIQFRLPYGQTKITLLTPLPEMFEAVQIDGFAQPGAYGRPRVELEGRLAGGNGLVLHGSNSAVLGLILHGFDTGIVVCDGTRSLVAGCWLGLDASGISKAGVMHTGIAVLDSSDNMIGGYDARLRNLVVGCDVGVMIGGTLDATGNRVLGNWIGLDVTGDGVIANNVGIKVDPAKGHDNWIGGYKAGGGNVVSGSLAGGIVLGDHSVATHVEGNLVGTDPTGTKLLGNGIGISSDGRDDVIGGWDAGAGNVVAGASEGIDLLGAQGARVIKNFVGTDRTGTQPLPNFTGMKLDYGANDNLVCENVIAYNQSVGVSLIDGARNGLRYNTVAYNGDMGVLVWETNADSTIRHNLITENVRSGVLLFGKRATVQFNTISNNLENGVVVGTQWLGVPAVANEIRANSIFDNGLLGIDLGADAYGNGDGVTPNDMLDHDVGPNALTNFPVLDQALAVGPITYVHGTYYAHPNTTYSMDFFSNPTLDASGYGEGKVFFGTKNVTTNSMGMATFEFWFVATSKLGDYVTATATDPFGNTSEFSLARVLEKGPVPPR